MSASVDPPPYVHLSTARRSLDVATRQWALGCVAATALGVAAAAAAVGAWPVMPFAGLEVAALAFAFRVLREHDADFERLEVDGHEVRLEARDARRVVRFVAHRPWARVVVREQGRSCTLALAYAGRTVPLGRMLSDEGRRQLAESLRGRLTVTTN